MATFPSVEWFEIVAKEFASDQERAKRVGYVEANVGILVEDGGRTSGYVLEFAGYGPRSARVVANPVAESDFAIAGGIDAWREMIENVAKHGEPDLEHTLNRLTMAGTPLRLLGDDQLQMDLFFRCNQSFQAFFDASAAVKSEFPALAHA